MARRRLAQYLLFRRQTSRNSFPRRNTETSSSRRHYSSRARASLILSNSDVVTTIPGMRKVRNVEANIAASGKAALAADLVAELRKHRWVRQLHSPENRWK